MRIVVTSSGAHLEAQVHPAFGRCPIFIFVDTQTFEFEALENPAQNAAGGAGIQAAQFVVEQRAQAVVTGSVGPNAFQVLQPAGIPIYLFDGGTVRQAVEAYRAGVLPAAGGASGPAHTGTDRGGAVPEPSHEEIATLRETARELRRQVAEVMERLDRLETGANTLQKPPAAQGTGDGGG